MKLKSGVTVVIHVYNDEKNIADCIKSAYALTENVVIVDQASTDRSNQIALNEGAHIVSAPFSKYVEPLREFGINHASTEWVFILDTDERMTKELASEIKSAIKSNSYAYYKSPRKNIFGKVKWLKHGGWWPDYQIRLINKTLFQKWPKAIHSTPQIKGDMGFLKNPLLHFFHGDFESMVKKTIIFEDIESDLLFAADRPVSTATFFRKYFGELYRRLIKHRGFIDGTVGIIESIYQAFSKTITYLYLYEKKTGRSVRSLS